jgi:hypothetical protein
MRQRQLNLVANARAIEQLAASLANAARATGELDARNALAIAQVRSATLLAGIDLKIANAQMLAQLYGRQDQLVNAQAQSDLLHQVANFIAGQQADMKMANARQIGEARADAIHTPAIVQEQNGVAMGANALLAADFALQAGELNASSVVVAGTAKSQAVLDAAAVKLHAARVRAVRLL